MMTLRCYCCGEKLPMKFALVTMKEETDRVFIMKIDHVTRLDKSTYFVPVRIDDDSG